MVLAQTEQNHQVEKARGSKGQHSTTLQKTTEKSRRETEPVDPTKRRRSSVDMKELHHRGRLGAAENVMSRSMFPEISTEGTERSNNGKGSEDHEESTSRGGDSRLCQSELLRDVYARARGKLQSAFHIIQAGSDLFIGKNEANMMNRKKKDKSVLRKEGNVCVLDSFVKVPSGATAPIKYKPIGS